jgi:hypothetical protein
MRTLHACPPALAWVQETEGTVEELWERCDELGWMVWLLVGLLTQHPPQTWRRPAANIVADGIARRRADRVRREIEARLEMDGEEDGGHAIPYDRHSEWPFHTESADHASSYRAALARMRKAYPAQYVAALIHSYYDGTTEKTQ